MSMFFPYYRLYQSLKPFAAILDLEKYFDIYEISRTDLEEAELVANVESVETQDVDTLHDLKVGLQKLHILRKLVLCTLLALDADGSKLDFRRWSVAVEMMCSFTSLTTRMISNIHEVMGEEEGKPGHLGSVVPKIDQALVRIPHSTYSEDSVDSRGRAHAKPNASFGQPLSGYPWPPGENAATSGRVWQSSGAFG